MANSEPVRLIVDCDTGVDDALALLYLARRPDVELVAIGSVHGNVPAEVGAANTLQVLELAGAGHVPVAVGARRPLAQDLDTAESVHGPDGLGGTARAPRGHVTDESAVEQLVRLVRANPGEISLLAVGPLTNLGLALLVEPDLPRLVRQVTIMGGAFSVPGNVTATAEANVWHDPEAARLVFGAGWAQGPERLRAVGLDVTDRTLLRAPQLARLAESDRPVARFASSMLAWYVDFYERRLGERACAVHDGLAAALLLEPELATWDLRPVDVELRGELTRGTTIVDRRPQAGDSGGRPPVAVATEVDDAGALERLMAALLA
jgi:purine nucleosidase